MVMFEGYFDESGSFNEESGIFCISGYFLTAENARAMDAEWLRVLIDHKLPYFHMVDCAHGNKTCAEMPVEERSEIASKCIALIKEFTLEGFSALTRKDNFAPTEDAPDVYSYCVSLSVQALRAFLKSIDATGELAFFFESGHNSQGRAYNHVAKEIANLSASLSFADKRDVRLLQAADLLAWQSTKFAKDQSSGARPPRKDFLDLMGHNHCLYFVTVKDGEQMFSQLAWPASRRSQRSAQLTVKYDGPVSYLLQAGEELPIFPAADVIGWREGGGRMAYIAFKDPQGKTFYLALDDIRLYHTVSALLAASKIYSIRGLPAISVEGASLSVTTENDEETVVHIAIPDGPGLSVRFPTGAVRRFKESKE